MTFGSEGGTPEEEVRGLYPGDWRFVHEEDAEAVGRVMDGLLASDVPRNISVSRNCTKGGGGVHCEWYNSVLTDAEGRLVSVLSLIQDVTDRREAEAQLLHLGLHTERHRPPGPARPRGTPSHEALSEVDACLMGAGGAGRSGPGVNPRTAILRRSCRPPADAPRRDLRLRGGGHRQPASFRHPNRVAPLQRLHDPPDASPATSSKYSVSPGREPTRQNPAH